MPSSPVKEIFLDGNWVLYSLLYEGLYEEASLQAWIWKTAFLVAITSAARVGELQAVESHPDLPRVHWFKVTL